MQSTVTKDRERYLGGSDIPAVMGISPFISRYELLQYKVGIRNNDFGGNEYTEYGNIMESKIRDYINWYYRYNFVESKKILKDSDVLPTRYHADGDDSKERVLLEVKTTSQVKKNVNDYKVYLVQLLKGMLTYKYNNGMLAVYDRPDDLSEEFDPSRLQVFSIGIEDYEDLINDITKADADFREDYKYLMEHPWADEADLPSRCELIPIAQQLMGLETSIAQAQAIVKQYDDLKKELCAQMVEHGVKSWVMPNGTKVTLIPKGEDTICKAFDEKAFKKDHEDLYGEYTIDKIKKGKSAYVRVTPLAKAE